MARPGKRARRPSTRALLSAGLRPRKKWRYSRGRERSKTASSVSPAPVRDAGVLRVCPLGAPGTPKVSASVSGGATRRRRGRGVGERRWAGGAVNARESFRVPCFLPRETGRRGGRFREKGGGRGQPHAAPAPLLPPPPLAFRAARILATRFG